jgi:predicted lysophospholipase L1 biosynthesis ABC-type transport system permease subunit
VVARLAPDGRIVVSCRELARVTDLGCPLPQYEEGFFLVQDYLRAEDLFTLPYPDASAADSIFQPTGFVEPGPDATGLPVQTLLIPTGGSPAAQERVRTLAAVAVPGSRSKTSEDLDSGPPVDLTAISDVLPYAMVFVLIFTACSLTVSVITGVLERRRPFALLRASGVRLGELRRIVLLETAAPLGLTVLFGVGLATVQALVMIPPGDWILPSAEFFAGLGAGVLAAFVVSLAALPFLDPATRLDTARFE